MRKVKRKKYNHSVRKYAILRPLLKLMVKFLDQNFVAVFPDIQLKGDTQRGKKVRNIPN